MIALVSISSSVWSSSVYSERSIGMPDEISVAYWREKIASGRALTLLKRWNTDSSLNASRFSETSRTISPRWRSCSVTAAFEDASTSPRDGTPARSTALNPNIAMA